MYSENPLKLIELAGRTCYKSEDKITDDSAASFVQKLNKLGHLSVLEHSCMSVKFITDRGVSHELVRHRLASYSQESTRYCNYSSGLTFIIPVWMFIEPDDEFTEEKLLSMDLNYNQRVFLRYLLDCERTYKELLFAGWTPQLARQVLPNSLKTEIVMTANLREWHHVLKLRTSPNAHPQMRRLMIPLLNYCKQNIPVMFDNIEA
jgi:thymidylate synthase (FAD)